MQVEWQTGLLLTKVFLLTLGGASLTRAGQTHNKLFFFKKGTSDSCALVMYVFLNFFLLYQEGGSRDGKGLLVEIGAAEQQQDVCSVLCLVELQELSQFPQLLQVWRKLYPRTTSKQWRFSWVTRFPYRKKTFFFLQIYQRQGPIVGSLSAINDTRH